SLPEGTANIEDAPLGTIVTLEAKANVPLKAAWIEYQPELTPGTPAVLTGIPTALSGLAVPGGSHAPLAGALVASATLQDALGPQRARLDEDRRTFFVRFQPRLSGRFVLYFEDTTGIVNDRSYDLHIKLDPTPTVTLERPTPTRESLEVLPGAPLP